ncbi:MAG: hypothetical protein WDN26_12495 [Chitinophagaceae bacterium]
MRPFDLAQGNPDSYRERRPDKHRGLRQLLSKEQEDEWSVATADDSPRDAAHSNAAGPI